MGYRHASVMREFHRLFSLGTVGAMTDSQLIAQFLAARDDGANAAFEGLVERHGPMVLRVCRSVLRDEHDAEDAFQTTFLVLARKARSLWVRDSLASWLHGVAYRVASKARIDAMRRRHHELEAGAWTAMEAATIPNVSWSDDDAIISEEIAGLPEKYRAPIVLCYLEAMSYQAAASRLGLTEDTVRGRLARARERLRSRLTCRGVEASTILGASRKAIPSTIIVRPALLHSTIEAAMNVSVRRSVEGFLSFETAVSLGERIGTAMIRTKLRTALLTTLTIGLISAGVVVVAQPTGGRQDQPPGPAGTRNSTVPAAGPNGGNLIVDWTPVGRNSKKTEITVDATRHCVHLAEMSLKRDARPNDGAIRVDLERGKTYTVAATGEAFMTSSTGPDADPFPGVVLVYGTDEEDGYAIRQAVLAPGKSITFKTPWAINPEDEVCLMAFFLDISPETSKRGSYKLVVTSAGQNATKFLREAVDFVDPSTAARRSLDGGQPGLGAGSGMR
jgi:RNA polymerase sigma factor (sigma-70 family)